MRQIKRCDHPNTDGATVRLKDVPLYITIIEILKAWEASIKIKSEQLLSNFLDEDYEI